MAHTHDNVQTPVPQESGIRASLPSARWRKSRHSNPSGDCVEVAELLSGHVAVRDSRDPDGPALVFARSEWATFIRGARGGELG
jgi:hypothetical protein